MAVGGLNFFSKFPGARTLMKSGLNVSHSGLNVQLGSLKCDNPVGLAAGFDKSATLLDALPYMGFGFVEVGSLTPLPQAGQKKPRLFRYKNQHALVNRMGFNNGGVIEAVKSFQKYKSGGGSVPIGINIGKGKETPLKDAHLDYVAAFEAVFPYADYIAINLSSPNTPELRQLQGAAYFEDILSEIQERNQALSKKQNRSAQMIFVKIAPDQSENIVPSIAKSVVKTGVGIIATNTTAEHEMDESGGLSGEPLKMKSDHVLKDVYQATEGKVPIIGVGGIFSAEDAYQKIKLGASLVQVYTGWIYNGPGLVPEINRGLIRLMRNDGFVSIQDVVGIAARAA